MVSGKDKEKGKRKAKSDGPLNRPIICICNDLHAPVLRNLREVAQVYRFQAPTVARLAERLKQVCQAEGMAADVRGLECLARRTECDVRACLNALQLLHRCGRGATVETLSSDASVGAKDFTLGVMDAWRAVFSRARRAKVKGSHHAEPLPPAEAAAAETRRVLAALYAVGEHDLVLTGIFGNLANLRHARRCEPSLPLSVPARPALSAFREATEDVRPPPQLHGRALPENDQGAGVAV